MSCVWQLQIKRKYDDDDDDALKFAGTYTVDWIA